VKWALGILKDTFKEFNEDRVLRLSAAMAYYAIFSIGPLLVLVIGLAGMAFGEDNVRRAVGQQLQSLMGESSAKAVESMMSARKEADSLIATIVGGIALVFGATGVFGQLQDSLNTIWEVKAKPGAGIMGFLRQRFLSMSMVLGIGFLLLISMALSAFVNAMAEYIGYLISLPAWVAQVFNEILSFGVISVLFALIFKVLPDVKIRWRHVWVGAIGTALLFTAGKFLLGLYLGKQSTASAYGAGTAFVLILMYIYYSSLILFFGAEFTQVYAKRRGALVAPSKYAVPVTEEARAQEGMASGAKHAAPGSAEKPAHAGSKRPQKEAQPVAGYAMEQQAKPHTPHPAPGETIRARRWSFVGLALTMGMVAGVLLRFKTLRKALKFYTAAQRI
jgi:membrane protein